MEFGLNAGYEIPGKNTPPTNGAGVVNHGVEEDEFGNTVYVPLDESVVTETEIAFEQLERVKDALYLIGDISRSGGMSRGFAEEAERILPSFGGVPLAYYSESPSATRMRVSLEELSKGAWGLIAAAAAALSLIIWKILSWFTGGSKSDGGKGGGTPSSSDKAGVANAANNKVEEVIQNAPDAGESVSDAASVCTEMLDNLNSDGVELDLGRGKEKTTFDRIVSAKFISASLRKTIDEMEKMEGVRLAVLYGGSGSAYTSYLSNMRNFPNKTNAAMQIVKELTAAVSGYISDVNNDKVDRALIKKIEKQAADISAKVTDYENFSKDLYNSTNEAKNLRSSRTLHLNEIPNQLVKQDLFKTVVLTFEPLTGIGDRLKELDDAILALEEMTEKQAASTANSDPSITAAARKIITTLKEFVMHIRTAMAAADFFKHNVMDVSRFVLGFYRNVFRAIDEKIKTDKAAVPHMWNETLRQYDQSIKAIVEKFKNIP